MWGDGGESDVVYISDLQDGSVPLLVVIHGGPQSAMLNHFNYRWNLATMASQGYGVLAVNFHGSTGFGARFCDSIRNDWGGKPLEDILRGTDLVLEKFPYLSAERTAALGASYGGYMVNWINGHSDRFRCLVNHDGVFSLRSQYFTNDELWFPEWEFGLPWERPDEYDKWSPDGFVSQWRTPTLVIHGGQDFRVCETEGIATFTALQRRGVPSQLLYFPDENHWVLKPLNSLKWHSTVFSWLHRWLQVVDVNVDEKVKNEAVV
jgi:dipeptidyl aminopeptidase/acylaminoacyl peptidase